jgi:hypothetical protein
MIVQHRRPTVGALKVAQLLHDAPAGVSVGDTLLRLGGKLVPETSTEASHLTAVPQELANFHSVFSLCCILQLRGVLCSLSQLA